MAGIVRFSLAALFVAAGLACSSEATTADVAADLTNADFVTDASTADAADLGWDKAGTDQITEPTGWWNAFPEAPVVAGVGVADITPEFESYTDSNANGHWDEGEPIDDVNKNGVLDTLEMGGFGWRHPTGVLDPLESRALALRVKGEWLVLAAVDSLGVGIQRTENIKTKVLAALGPGHEIARERLIIACIHTHSAPDTMGIFGEVGVDKEYLVMLEDRSAEAIVQAIHAARPARLGFGNTSVPEAVRDIDPPDRTDPYVGIIVVRDATDDSTIATLVAIGNHAETFWSENTLITSDYPHYLREELEKSQGGMGIFFMADEGLMQTPAELAPAGQERAEAVAALYAGAVVDAVQGIALQDPETTVATVGHSKIQTELENPSLYVGLVGGQIDGFEGWLYKNETPPCDFFGCFDLPVVVVKFGDAMTLVSLPGEFVPELVLGGMSIPEVYGGQYPDAPPEPILVEHLTTSSRFIIGLSGMDCGYIYPKMNHDPSNHFSQQHSPGPNAAMTLMTGIVALLDQVNGSAP